jgi:diguanylate cyclase (GGDEF)-like protein
MERSAGTDCRADTQKGNHYPCSMSAVLIAEVKELGGPAAVAELMKLSGTQRSLEYLTDLANWISYDEAIALWRAGMRVTHNPQLPRVLGQRAAERLASSPVAAALRSLGSPGKVYEQVATSATTFSTVVRMEAVEMGDHTAVLTCEPVEGFERAPEHCAWTVGLLRASPILFGLEHAKVEHDECAALGAPQCIYRIRWSDEPQHTGAAEPELDALRQQFDGLQERFNSLFAAASDLIAADEISDILARLTQRAAFEVRAPRYLLAVRLADGDVQVQQRGFDQAELSVHVDRMLDEQETEFPSSWLVVPVRSDRRYYGRLVAAFETDASFFPQERDLMEIFASYAASALDGASAVSEAKHRYDETSALLTLARAMASAGTSTEVAQRLSEAVPAVVDCDRSSVYLWDPGSQALVRAAMTSIDPDDPLLSEEWSRVPSRDGPIHQLLTEPKQDPVFVDAESGPPAFREEMLAAGNVAAIIVPIAAPDAFLGLLSVSVRQTPERLAPSADLLNRLSGVAAQATTALQNGRLVDQITHQAMHDQLTGLANRLQFTQELRRAISRAQRTSQLVTVLYMDLDRFKPVNDEFGHDVGDRVLVEVARRLDGCTRNADTVARLGGDEFAVLVADHQLPDETDQLCQRLTDAFREPFTVDGHELKLSACIGRAVFPNDADGADTLLRRADAAMFEAKRKLGRSDASRLAER